MLDLGLPYIHSLPGTHLLLQPHLDDLPFSIGHLLECGSITYTDYELWTIFGKEHFNIRHFPHNEETEALLRDEERRWSEQTGYKINRLELPEAGYRGVTGIRRLFLTSSYQDAKLDYESMGYWNWSEVIDNIRSLIHPKVQYVWIPAGIGGHCDHLAVRQAVIHLAQKSQHIQGLLFYHELPYAQYSKAIDWSLFSIEGFQYEGMIELEPSEQQVASKQKHISVFHSQINERQSITLARAKEQVSVWNRRVV